MKIKQEVWRHSGKVFKLDGFDIRAIKSNDFTINCHDAYDSKSTRAAYTANSIISKMIDSPQSDPAFTNYDDIIHLINQDRKVDNK